jgi:hypothetical protein
VEFLVQIDDIISIKCPGSQNKETFSLILIAVEIIDRAVEFF